MPACFELFILILERGDYRAREWVDGQPRAVFAKHRHRTDETGRDRHGRPFTTLTGYHASGHTGFYGAVLLRLLETDGPARRYPEDKGAVHVPLTIIAKAVRVADPIRTAGNRWAR